MKRFLQNWLINTLAVLVAVYIIPGIHFQRALDLFVASLLLGVFNAVFRPLLLALAFPLLIVTLGLFTFVINALVLYLVGFLLKPHFYVDGFWSAFFGGLVISFVALVLNVLTGNNQAKLRVESRRGPGKPRDHDGQGPIIDV